jgi:hypothetical protein
VGTYGWEVSGWGDKAGVIWSFTSIFFFLIQKYLITDARRFNGASIAGATYFISK